jgi:outer membrane protein assembly factor BamB
MCWTPRAFALLLAWIVMTPALADSADTAAKNTWAEWRGPSGQGYVDDAKVPLTWSTTQNLLWKTALPGNGNATPVIWGDRLFLAAASPKGDERYVLCVRTTDGSILWKQTASQGIDPGRTHTWNGFASSSCATDGTHVFAFFGTPGLFCYDFEGKLLWKKNLGVFTAESGWGSAASPMVFEDLVIQNCDNSGAKALPKGIKPDEAAPMALIAFNKQSGQEVWRTPRNQGMGWSTPVLIPMPNGRVDLVLNGPYGVWAYDPRTGKEIWHCERHKGDGQALFGEPIPIFDREKLVIQSGRPGPMLAIKLGGTGDVTKSHVLWDVSRKGSRDVGSSVLWKDVIYAGDNKGFLSANDVKTGATLFRERAGSRSFSASAVVVQDRILFLMEDGVTFVLEPSRQYKLERKNAVSDGTDFRASPVIVDGRLYLRSQANLYCIGAK